MAALVRVFEIRKSANDATVDCDSDESFPGLLSVAPAGVTVAVLSSGPPGVEAATVPAMVRVMLVPFGMVTGTEMPLPDPDGAEHEAPTPVGAHVQVTPVMAVGTASAITAAVAVDGPALVTVMV